MSFHYNQWSPLNPITSFKLHAVCAFLLQDEGSAEQRETDSVAATTHRADSTPTVST